MKCDIIIPVYKSPSWVKLCVYALFKNTNSESLGKVFLINDSTFDNFTNNCLANLKKKYGKKIELIQNKENLGFVKTVNKGLKLSTSDCVLLLNTDCIVSKNTVEKLMSHMETDEKIGLICPVSSNAANLTLEMFEGFSYQQMNELLEKNFKGKSFDACTVVGNCLMISKKCIDKIGGLDEAYGTGYGEETDYQFKAMSKGFSAKVAIDTYVFHQSEASFGTSKEKQEKLRKNRDLFFSRWGEEYKKELAKYEQNDPIKYIRKNLTKEDSIPKAQTLFYLDGIVQNAGGVHIVVDIVNYMAINGYSANILFNLKYPYKESMLFEPIPAAHTDKVKVGQIVSTVWKSAFAARKIADKKNAKLISFIQGYEAYFEGGNVYGMVETSYKLADSIFVISDYLKKELKDVFNLESHTIQNGIQYDLLHEEHSAKAKQETPVITIILRNNVMKGDWLLIDIAKKLSNILDKNYKLNIVVLNRKTVLPDLQTHGLNVEIFDGPLSREEIYKILQSSDIYVDTSLSEGFGLTALEAMAAGCVPIVSNSLGVNDYIANMENGILISRVNDPNAYVGALKRLLRDNNLLKKMQAEGKSTAKKFDFDSTFNNYINYFDNLQKYQNEPRKLTDEDLKIIEKMSGDRRGHAKKIAAFETVKKLTPKPIKERAVQMIEKLYNYYH